jgi:hypothetical protein
VTEAVVDRLEVVEVHEDHGQPGALAAGTWDRVPDALDEQRAVGEVGDGIVDASALPSLGAVPPPTGRDADDRHGR